MMHLKGVRNAYLYAVVLLLALTFVSCEETKMPPSNEPPPNGTIENGVYISGTGMNGYGVAVATYWKNSVPVNLTATYPDAVVYNSAAFGMTISGNDLYVCGVIWTSKGGYPIYWKNGSPVVLAPGNGQATAISVVGENIYVSGIVSDNGNSYGVIWKNGVISFLTEGTTYSNATSLVVSGQNVYVGGYLAQDEKVYATIWKNGTPQLLTSGDNYAFVQSLALAGETVYAAGTELGTTIGKYWKDGVPVNLTDGSSGVMVTAVYTKGNDVYAAGKRQVGGSWELVVWKNDIIITTAPITAFNIEIEKIALTQNNVLVTGNVVFVNENSSVYANATVWTNGDPVTLPQGADGTNVCFANSIVVKN